LENIEISNNGTYIKNFGIANFSDRDLQFLFNEDDKTVIDEFLEKYHGVKYKYYNPQQNRLLC